MPLTGSVKQMKLVNPVPGAERARRVTPSMQKIRSDMLKVEVRESVKKITVWPAVPSKRKKSKSEDDERAPRRVRPGTNASAVAGASLDSVSETAPVVPRASS